MYEAERPSGKGVLLSNLQENAVPGVGFEKARFADCYVIEEIPNNNCGAGGVAKKVTGAETMVLIKCKAL